MLTLCRVEPSPISPETKEIIIQPVLRGNRLPLKKTKRATEAVTGITGLSMLLRTVQYTRLVDTFLHFTSDRDRPSSRRERPTDGWRGRAKPLWEGIFGTKGRFGLGLLSLVAPYS